MEGIKSIFKSPSSQQFQITGEIKSVGSHLPGCFKDVFCDVTGSFLAGKASQSVTMGTLILLLLKKGPNLPLIQRKTWYQPRKRKPSSIKVVSISLLDVIPMPLCGHALPRSAEDCPSSAFAIELFEDEHYIYRPQNDFQVHILNDERAIRRRKLGSVFGEDSKGSGREDFGLEGDSYA